VFYRDRPNHQAQRVYAIGDVHGRFDLFRQLMGLIRIDHIQRAAVRTKIIVLGDIIDRGPDSARLVHGCMNLSRSNDGFVVLKGNHEEMMVQALTGDIDAYRVWLHFGGRETLKSWNVDPIHTTETPTKGDLKAAAKMVGKEVIAWLDDLPLYHRHDDFLFVHAGIRPSVPMRRQDSSDLLWITDEFLSSKVDHGVIVIHGHSITEAGPDVRSNRIGIDTGAYRTNRLTAIGVEQRDTWFLNTASYDDRARIDHFDSSMMSTMASERDGPGQWL
jgi:serine/threonine protein phosphatase 1